MHKHFLRSVGSIALLALVCCKSANGAQGPLVGVGGSTQSTTGRASGNAATPQPDASVAASQAGRGGAGAPATSGVAGTATAGSAGTTGAAGNASAAAGNAAGAGGAGAAGAAGSAATGCDRSCLLQVMQQYLDAVIMHDPTKVKISPMVKMTDNGAPAKPGDGLWKTATMLVADERLDYADPVMKNVGTQCVINEGSTPAMYEVRLKVDGGQITEIETMTVRQQDAANGFFDPTNLKPQPVFLQKPDPAKRMTRDQLMALQMLYLDYLEGKKAGSELPFDTNCARYENGVSTASGVASFNLQSWGFQVTRRVLILDEEAGITWGMFPFSQAADSLVVGEAFKLMDGKIMMIQAVMANMPAKAWD